MRALVVPAAVAVVAIVVVLAVAGRGSSVSSRVGKAAGESVTCERVGIMVVVGKRERVYECQRQDGSTAGCYAIADGDVVDVSAEADALDSAFVCS